MAALALGTDGKVYVRTNEMHEQPTPASHWLVFDAAGQLLGRLETGSNVSLSAFGVGFVLGQVRDQDGAARTYRYAIQPSKDSTGTVR